MRPRDFQYSLLGTAILVMLVFAACGKATGPSGEVPLTLRAMAVGSTSDATMLHRGGTPPDTLPVTYSQILLVVRDVSFKLAAVDTADTTGDDDPMAFLASNGGFGGLGGGDDDDDHGEDDGDHGHGEDSHGHGHGFPRPEDGMKITFKGPFVVDLLTQTSDSLDTQMVPPGEYKKTQGHIAPLQADDWNAGDFEFLVGSTVYLAGTVDGEGGGDFTYSAPIRHSFKIKGRFIVEEDTPATAFLTFDTSNWLRGKHGQFLDPRDPANDLAIRQAIVRSIKAGMDSNHDGKCDWMNGE
jgi:hypothetical protein